MRSRAGFGVPRTWQVGFETPNSLSALPCTLWFPPVGLFVEMRFTAFLGAGLSLASLFSAVVSGTIEAIRCDDVHS